MIAEFFTSVYKLLDNMTAFFYSTYDPQAKTYLKSERNATLGFWASV